MPSNRAKIIDLIAKEGPLNANQITHRLRYKKRSLVTDYLHNLYKFDWLERERDVNASFKPYVYSLGEEAKYVISEYGSFKEYEIRMTIKRLKKMGVDIDEIQKYKVE